MVSRSSMVNYYKELGIDRHATSTDIRTAYKRLALIWHPDRNQSQNAEERFKKIKQAYDILIDENQRQRYDQQNIDYTRPTKESFTLHTFEPSMAIPINPFDILSDIQFFQESDFTSKMMNSTSYRNLFTHLFTTMNNDTPDIHHIHSSSPIYINNDRLFRPIPKTRSKHRPSSKRSSIHHIPVIHSTMSNDWFLNELIDLHERQNHCTHCHKKSSMERNRYTKFPSKYARV